MSVVVLLEEKTNREVKELDYADILVLQEHFHINNVTWAPYNKSKTLFRSQIKFILVPAQRVICTYAITIIVIHIYYEAQWELIELHL